MLQRRILDTIARFQMFSPGQRVGVSVSGGADSVCLLYALHEFAPRWNLQLSVIHVDHGIRGAASQADADFVHQMAQNFAVPFHFRRADVPAIEDNLEQAARNVRLSFFRELIGAGTIDRIATGHTRSDQAETVLFRILRGTGLTGLAGIHPLTREGIVRPLLYCTRGEVREWMRDRQIAWREDETNENRVHARNRIRHELLPQLRREFNPQLDEALANLAEIARDEIHPVPDAPMDPRCLPVEGLTRQAIRRAIENARGDLRQIDFRHIEAVREIARSPEGHGRIQLPGVEVLRSLDCIRLIPAGEIPGTTDYTIPINPPETVEIPAIGGQIGFQIVDRQRTSDLSNPYDSLVDELDWEKITSIPAPVRPSGLELRNWRPGDRYRRVGHSHEKKIKILFQEARVPVWERGGWPVLIAGGKIAWARKFGPAAECISSAATRIVLQIRDRN